MASFLSKPAVPLAALQTPVPSPGFGLEVQHTLDSSYILVPSLHSSLYLSSYIYIDLSTCVLPL